MDINKKSLPGAIALKKGMMAPAGYVFQLGLLMVQNMPKIKKPAAKSHGLALNSGLLLSVGP